MLSLAPARPAVEQVDLTQLEDPALWQALAVMLVDDQETWQIPDLFYAHGALVAAIVLHLMPRLPEPVVALGQAYTRQIPNDAWGRTLLRSVYAEANQVQPATA